ncbi:MAG TPA: hypothetical protein VIC58_08820 [Actinomycetota bacterium]|jgi:hypothetical protein
MYDKRKQDDETPESAQARRDEQAYEYAWYRALKAQSERRLGEDPKDDRDPRPREDTEQASDEAPVSQTPVD